MVHTFLLHDLLPSTGWFQDLNTIRQNKQFFIFTTMFVLVHQTGQHKTSSNFNCVKICRHRLKTCIVGLLL